MVKWVVLYVSKCFVICFYGVLELKDVTFAPKPLDLQNSLPTFWIDICRGNIAIILISTMQVWGSLGSIIVFESLWQDTELKIGTCTREDPNGAMTCSIGGCTFEDLLTHNLESHIVKIHYFHSSLHFCFFLFLLFFFPRSDSQLGLENRLRLTLLSLCLPFPLGPPCHLRFSLSLLLHLLRVIKVIWILMLRVKKHLF